MNKARRNELKKAYDILWEVQRMIEQIGEEEREAYENLPYSLQESDRGTQMDEYAYTLEEISCEIEERMAQIEEIVYA